MQIGEFIEATGRLEKYYDKEYANEQRQIMFDELQGLDINRYKKLISLVIKTSKFLPKVADILEVNRQQPYNIDKEEKQKIECKKCNGTGYLLYTKRINNGDRFLKYTYAAICDCGNATQYDGTKINDKEHRSKYYISYAKELNLVN